MIEQGNHVAAPMVRHLLKRIGDLRKSGATADVHLGTEVGFAKEFGISRMTVRRAMDDLIAQGLVVRRRGKGVFLPPPSSIQQIIQFVSPNLCYENCIQYLKGVQSVMEGRNYGIQIYDANSDFNHAIELIDQLPRTRAAGAIIVAIYNPRFIERLIRLQQRKHPFVVLGNLSELLDVPMIAGDFVPCGRELGNDLLDKGHRLIGHICHQSIPNRQLADGLNAALNDRGVGWPTRYRIDITKRVEPLGDWTRVIHEATKELMSLDEPPTALLYNDDRAALYAYQWFRASGYSVPEDVSVIGVGDNEMGRLAFPPLSSVVEPNYESGRQAIDMLEKRLNLVGEPPEQRKLEAHWICRESVKSLV
jgi:DNA-binding LacI/PurR family transcriptional regulator